LAGRDKNVVVVVVVVGTLVPKGVTATELEVEISVSLADAETEIGVDVVEVRDGRTGVTRKEELVVVGAVDPMGRKLLSSGPGLDEISISSS